MPPILAVDVWSNVTFSEFGGSAAQASHTMCRLTRAPGLALPGLGGSGATVHALAPLNTVEYR